MVYTVLCYLIWRLICDSVYLFDKTLFWKYLTALVQISPNLNAFLVIVWEWAKAGFWVR